MSEPRPTFCRVCEPACGLLATVDGDRVVSLKPDREHPVSKGFACHKGVRYVDIHQDPDRLDTPLRREGSREPGEGAFESVDWDTAAEAIGARLRAIQEEHGKESVALYGGNPAAFNALATQAVGEFVGALKIRRVFNAGTQDCSNKFAAAEAVFGTSTLHPVPDIANTDCLLLFGENPHVSHMSFISIADPMAKIRDAVGRGAKVFYVNPRQIESAGPRTGEVVPILPDTDLYLMAALLNEIDALGRFDERVLAEHGEHVEGLRAFIEPYDADAVAGVVGLPAERIRELADIFSGAERAAVHMSTGVNMGRQGTLCYWLLQMLAFVTGNLDRVGGNFYGEGFYPAAKTGKPRHGDTPYFESPFGELRTIRGALPGNLLPDMILADESPVRALIVIAGNPLLSVGGEARWREALAHLDLLVVVDLFRNATGEYAHWLLPAADMLERPDVTICGLGMQYEAYAQYTDALVEPAAERKEEWWILARLQQAMGLPSALDAETPAPLARMDRMLARSGLSIDGLRSSESGTAVLDKQPVGRLYDEFVQTENGRVDCCPPLFEEAIAQAHRIFAELSDAPPAYRLINLRTPRMHNSWFQNVERLKRGIFATNPLHIAPSDMEGARLEEGDAISVWNEHGRVEALAHADDSLRPGVVAMTHGGGNGRTPGLRVAQRYPGVNVNALLPSGPGSYEKLSNQAFMSGVPVNVELVSERR